MLASVLSDPIKLLRPRGRDSGAENAATQRGHGCRRIRKGPIDCRRTLKLERRGGQALIACELDDDVIPRHFDVRNVWSSRRLAEHAYHIEANRAVGSIVATAKSWAIFINS